MSGGYHAGMTTSPYPLGAHPIQGGATFRVWAPLAKTVDLKLTAGSGAPRTITMKRHGDFFEAVVEGAGPGTQYLYVIDGERERPDPRSRRQPLGVHGPSEVVDPAAHAWTDAGWKGLPLEDLIIYELHIGTFTPEGTFDAAIGKLDYLKDLGVNTIELMPVSAFPGTRNWGYDGVHYFAPQDSYGGPGGLKRLVDAAHAMGFAVFMDVVYNHLGPEGNYLREFGPYFTDRYKTPWGDALNYDGENSAEVRRWAIDNAVYWVEEFHMDGLRLDAVFAIFDMSDPHVLAEIAAEVQAAGEKAGRSAYVTAESPLNDARLVRPRPEGCGLDAHWNDDYHHAVRTAMTGDNRGYLSPFGRMDDIRKAVAIGYVRPGEDYRTHQPIEEPGEAGDPLPAARSLDLPGQRIISFIQNHDQVANISAGKRLPEVVGLDGARAAALLLFATPSIPLLFMGEEYAEPNRFLFFVDFGDEYLRDVVRGGRAREMAGMCVQTLTEALEDDATDPRTFERSRLGWNLSEPRRAAMLRLYKDLIALRRRTPALGELRKDLSSCVVDESKKTVLVLRGHPSAKPVLLAANLGPAPATVDVPGATSGFRPKTGWERILFSEDPLYGGRGADLVPDAWAPGSEIVFPPRSAALYIGG